MDVIVEKLLSLQTSLGMEPSYRGDISNCGAYAAHELLDKIEAHVYGVDLFKAAKAHDDASDEDDDASDEHDDADKEDEVSDEELSDSQTPSASPPPSSQSSPSPPPSSHSSPSPSPPPPPDTSAETDTDSESEGDDSSDSSVNWTELRKQLDAIGPLGGRYFQSEYDDRYIPTAHITEQPKKIKKHFWNRTK